MMMRITSPTTGTLAAVLIVLAAFGSFSGFTQDQEAEQGAEFANQLSQSFRYAVHQVLPAVVSISAEAQIERPQDLSEQMPEIPEMFKHFFPPEMFEGNGGNIVPQRRSWQGSGVIISKEGEILTNNHVVNDATELDITLDDGRRMTAEVVATDPGSDIALIKLKGEGPFPFAELGDSDQLQVGDWVLAIGNPFGLSQSVSEGIVSALGRTSEDVPVGGAEFIIRDYIQTTAAINPGNSGGPLVNLRGEIIGVNNAIQTAGVAANIGIGFAIPSNIAKSVITSLKEYGKVRRGYIGVQLRPLSSDIIDYYQQEYNMSLSAGALVEQVLPGTPGAKAGLQPGDLIVEYNGKKVTGSGQLVNLVTSTEVGTEVELKILRKGEEQTMKLTLEERPEAEQLVKADRGGEESGSLPKRLLGLSVQDFDQNLATQMGYGEEVKGVIVTGVDPGSAAARVDIQKGDIVSEFNDTPVQTAAEFEKRLSDIRKQMKDKGDTSRTLLLYVHRANSEFHPRYVAPTLQVTEEPEAETEE
jgi:serine protease Do